MRIAVALLLAALSLSNGACSYQSPDSPLHDRVTTAAQELRWTKRTEGRTIVPLIEFDGPVVVLALPPGKYRAADLEPLLRQPEAQECLKQSIHDWTLEAKQPSIRIYQPTRSETTFYHHQIIVPRPLAIWKEDGRPLEVSLS